MAHRRLVRLWPVLVALLAGCSLFTDLDGLDGDALDGGADSAAADGRPSGADGGVDGTALGGYRAAVLEDAPVAYWRLGDAPGTLIPKNEVGASAGKYIGGLDLGVPGAVASDTAVHFASGSVEIGDQFDFAGDLPMSIEAWLEASSPEGAVLQKQRSDTGAGWSFFLWSEASDQPVLRFDRLESFNTGRTVCIMRFKEVPAPIALGDGHYHHVVLTYDTVTTRIYLDGVERQHCENPPLVIPDSDASLGFGGSLDGGLDEIALYDKSLAPPRVKAHFDAASAH